MQVVYTNMDKQLTNRLLGELDHHAAKQAMQDIGGIIDTNLPKTCILDLSGVTFMDSSGIAVILRTRQRINEINGSLSVKGTPPQAKRVLDSTGIYKIVSFK
jgi:stage II sporulation protein AA (anti-sigma F factor antagonist)